MLKVPGVKNVERFATEAPWSCSTPSLERTRVVPLSPVVREPLSQMAMSSLIVTGPAIPLRLRDSVGAILAMLKGNHDDVFLLPLVSFAWLLQVCVPAGKSVRVRL